jgi:hypothetical protein
MLLPAAALTGCVGPPLYDNAITLFRERDN